MLLKTAHIRMFKSIEDSSSVPIDASVTVLVGQNESGKTAFLQSLHKALPIEKDGVSYDVVQDYPRRQLTSYQRTHGESPATVAELTYNLEENEIKAINRELNFNLLENLSFTVTYKYNNTYSISISIPENDYVYHIISKATLSAETRQAVGTIKTLRDLIRALDSRDLNGEETAFRDNLKATFTDAPTWQALLSLYLWRKYLTSWRPRFLYFDDYYLLPGKVNLTQLQQRVSNNSLREEDKTVLSLLSLAGIDLEDLTITSGYEEVKANLEGISNTITDTVFKYWTQNRDLDVQIDIRPDPKDEAPFNSGNNLYIRIHNRKHRVTVPFSQRSKGFIWFFSFLVWFGNIKDQLGTNSNLVLLLDEPGLSLHALGQADLLRYIDELAEKHQLIYTTHSPFMVHSDRLHQVRTVQDRSGEGTKVTENVSGSDPKTLFPLQAALGYTIAQNLFISKRNLLVEGPADLIYLRYFSSVLDTLGRPGLRDDIIVVPVGGLDKLATFVALLRGNELEIAVLHDYANRPDARLESLVRERLIQQRQVLNYGMFRSQSSAQASSAIIPSSDVEDLMTPALYLRLFNAAYKKQLGTAVIKESDLPPGDRIVLRLEQYLQANGIQVRPSGGFNHYLIANHLASHPIDPSRVDKDTLARFERMFQTVNSNYSHD
jgi:hypothetical protein